MSKQSWTELSNREFFIRRWTQEHPAFVEYLRRYPPPALIIGRIPTFARQGNWLPCSFRLRRVVANSVRQGEILTTAMCAGTRVRVFGTDD